MSAQRCPACGQPNPPQAEICQYCQVRLRPPREESYLTTSPSPDEQGSKRSGLPESDEVSLPAWLNTVDAGLRQEESLPSGQSAARAFSPEEALSTDDWLDELFSGGSSGQGEEIPAWLRSLKSTPEDEAKDNWPPSPSPTNLPPPSSEILPEALQFKETSPRSQNERQGKVGQESRTVPPFEGIDSSAAIAHSLSLQEQPDLSAGTEETTSTSLPTAPSAEEGWMDELPAWLETLPGLEPREEQGVPPELLQGAIPPFVEAEGELSGVEFPAWLDEAERSVEPEFDTIMDRLSSQTVKASFEEQGPEGASPQPPPPFLFQEEEAVIEIAGPLHGLPDVLPAQPLIAAQGRPSQPIAELLVTEKQRAQAELFLKILEEEGKPTPPLPVRRARPNPFWRVFIFLALLAAAVVGLTASPFASAPPELSVAVFDAMQAVAQLPTEATVLLVADTEGGNFAEMQATTNALLDQMMSKGAFFVLVSTEQAGALQGDRLLREVSRLNGHRYQPSSGWVNLGYLPGGATGIQALSDSVVELLPLTVDGEQAWQQERLKRIRSISDFDLVLVVTEDSTRARQWIEQLKGKVAPSQLLFAVSAQVEPVLRPYYATDPRQVQSVLAGLRDGAIYETQANRPGWAIGLWNAYPTVVAASVILITLGASVYALLGLIPRKGSPGEGDL